VKRDEIKTVLNIVRPANIAAMLAPRFALKREEARIRLNILREIKNSGYGESGGSTKKKSLFGWLASSKSPQEDIDPHLHTLRQRSRSLFMGSPLGRSAISTKKTNTIGIGLMLKSRIDFEFLGLSREGLMLKSRIDFEFLGLSREEAQEREKIIEREFELFARSKWCDALRLNNFYELQSLAYSSWLISGDGWCLLKQEEPTSWMPYGLRLHLIEADRVSTPDTSERVTTSFYSFRPSVVGKLERTKKLAIISLMVSKSIKMVLL